MKKFLKFSAILLSLILPLLFAGITAFAEPEDEPVPEPGETVTEAPSDEPTDPPTEPPTEAPTEAPTSPPEDPTEAAPTESEAASEETNPAEGVIESTPEPEDPTYNVDDLPPVEENEFIVPTSLVEDASPQSATAIAGMISWVCVAVGIIVIVAVLGSSKTGNYMNGGRQRYESGDIISGGKRR